MLKMASCDSQGRVYISETGVYRLIAPPHEASVREVLDIVGNEIEGLVDADICATDMLPPELSADNNSLVLRHERVGRISYPHEWCASMLQDAATFHLRLAESLLKMGVFLKDAHPWNILFDRGQPIFIDFTSLVTKNALFHESYLKSNLDYRDSPESVRIAMLVGEIHKRMYQPYFMAPILLYLIGNRERARERIEETTLNASTSLISRRDFLKRPMISRSSVKSIARVIRAKLSEDRIFLELSHKFDVRHFYNRLRSHVECLNVAAGGSAYSSYYQKKKEDQAVEYSETWNDKQRSVYDALNRSGIRSVLDVACNTGWFAMMAEKLGKSVVAFDIDESCVEVLYRRVRDFRLNILPLVMDFTKLTQDRYSIYDGNRILINATERLRSDSVIALGIIHHLALGLGLSFGEILASLFALSKKQVIIEFIEPNDPMIQNEPGFFPAYAKNTEILTGYNIQTLTKLIGDYGFDISVSRSHPETRKILICNRRVCV